MKMCASPKTGTKALSWPQGNNSTCYPRSTALCPDQTSAEPVALPAFFQSLSCFLFSPQVSPSKSLAQEFLSQALLLENLAQVPGSHYPHFTDKETGVQRGWL